MSREITKGDNLRSVLFIPIINKINKNARKRTARLQTTVNYKHLLPLQVDGIMYVNNKKFKKI